MQIARGRSRVTALAALLGLAGAACIVVAVMHQEHPAQLALSSLGPPPPAPALDQRSRGRAVSHPLASSLPVSVSIPAIGVRTSVLHLGLTAQGTLEVPPPGPHYDEAGWYRNSPAPGSVGPAVIVGHVDSATGGPSVFFRLGQLHAGDAVLVGRADGTVARFAVEDVRRYHKSAFPSQAVYGDTKGAALRLITCGGVFDAQRGHYVDNIVVFASLVREGILEHSSTVVAG